MGQIVGFSKFKSKKGSDCCIIKVLTPATERDNQFGHFGHVLNEIFVPDRQHGDITEDVIGHEVTVNYDYYNGKGFVNSISIQ